MAGLMNSTALGTTLGVDMLPREGAVREPMPGRIGDEGVATTVDDEETPNVSDEEQEAYEDFVLAGYKLIYDKGEVLPGILKMLDEDPTDLIGALGAGDAAEGEMLAKLQEASPSIRLAATAVIVVLQLAESVEEEDRDDTIIFHGGRAIYEDLAEVMEKAGFHTFEQEELDKGWLMAMDLYREAGKGTGLVDEDRAKADWNELVTADQEGRLGEYLPALQRINDEAGDDPAERQRIREEEQA